MKAKIVSLLARVWHLFFPSSPDVYLGRILIQILPRSYVNNIQKNFFRYSFRHGYLIKVIREELMRQYYSKTGLEFDKIRKLYWGGDIGRGYHNIKLEMYAMPGGYKNNFLKQRVPLVKFIKRFLKQRPDFHTICEIGTSNGVFLDYLSKELQNTGIQKFVGIDINQKQIAENRAKYKENKLLLFKYSQAANWIRKSGKGGTIFIGCAVFQCFTQEELEQLLNLMEKRAPVALGISESVNMDLKKDFQSSPRGNTYFSHNYPYLLKKYGYKTMGQTTQYHNPEKSHSTVILLATG